MTERIVELSDAILGLTREQGVRLAENDIEGVSMILDRRNMMIGELSDLLRVGEMPLKVRQSLELALDMGEAQNKTLTAKRTELSLEFMNTKRSIASVGAYEMGSFDSRALVGAVYDLAT